MNEGLGDGVTMAKRLPMTVLALGLLGPAASLAAMPTTGAPVSAPSLVRSVGGDCAAAAQQVVDETGGQLLSAEPAGDGQSCVITVLVQGDGTSRPRRIRVQVPM